MSGQAIDLKCKESILASIKHGSDDDARYLLGVAEVTFSKEEVDFLLETQPSFVLCTFLRREDITLDEEQIDMCLAKHVTHSEFYFSLFFNKNFLPNKKQFDQLVSTFFINIHISEEKKKRWEAKWESDELRSKFQGHSFTQKRAL